MKNAPGSKRPLLRKLTNALPVLILSPETDKNPNELRWIEAWWCLKRWCEPVILKQYSMQLTAKLLTLIPLQTGKGKNGDWKKQDFIVKTGDTYPKKICISVWGDKINPSVLVVGNELKIDFDVESREYNGGWYTDVKAWKI